MEKIRNNGMPIQGGFVPRVTGMQDEDGVRFESKKAMALYNDGMTDPDIALELGVNVMYITGWRKTLGMPEHSNKITEPEGKAAGGRGRDYDREKIQGLYDQGMNDCQIAKEVGVSSNTIMNWRRKKDLPTNGNSRWSNKQSAQKTTSAPVTAPEPVSASQEFFEEDDLDTIKETPDELPPLSAKAQRDADELLEDGNPPPMTMLAVMTLKILYDIWMVLGKEETA